MRRADRPFRRDIFKDRNHLACQLEAGRIEGRCEQRCPSGQEQMPARQVPRSHSPDQRGSALVHEVDRLDGAALVEEHVCDRQASSRENCGHGRRQVSSKVPAFRRLTGHARSASGTRWRTRCDGPSPNSRRPGIRLLHRCRLQHLRQPARASGADPRRTRSTLRLVRKMEPLRPRCRRGRRPPAGRASAR